MNRMVPQKIYHGRYSGILPFLTQLPNSWKKRDGLMLGICNGFQALIKLGLVHYGKIVEAKEDAPTLTYNSIGRHASCLVNTRIASVKSPWLAGTEVGDIHTIPVSRRGQIYRI